MLSNKSLTKKCGGNFRSFVQIGIEDIIKVLGLKAVNQGFMKSPVFPEKQGPLYDLFTKT